MKGIINNEILTTIIRLLNDYGTQTLWEVVDELKAHQSELTERDVLTQAVLHLHYLMAQRRVVVELTEIGVLYGLPQDL